MTRLLVRLVGAVIAAVMGLAGLAALGLWYASGRTLTSDSATDWLVGRLELDGYALEVGNVGVTIGDLRSPILITATDVSLREDAGHLTARVPSMTVTLSASDLLFGRVRPRTVELSGGELVVPTDDDYGPLILVAEDGAGSPDLRAAVVAALAGLADLPPDLEQVDVRAGRLVLRRPDADRIFELGLVALTAGEGGWSLMAEIAEPEAERRAGVRFGPLEIDAGNAMATAPLMLTVESGTDRARFTGVLSGAWERELAVAIEGEVEITYDDVDLAGEVSVQAIPGTPSVAGTARLTPVNLAEILDGLGLAGGLPRLDADVGGRIAFSVGGGLDTLKLDLGLDGGPGTFTAPDLLPAPISLRSLALAGHLDLADGRAEIDRFVVELPDAVLHASAESTRQADGWMMALSAEVRGLPTDRIGAYWPRGVAVGGRGWITANLSDGVVESGAMRITAWLPSGTDDASESGRLDAFLPAFDRFELLTYHGEVRFHEVTAHDMPGMLAVRGIDGVAEFVDGRMDLTTTSGQLGEIAVTSGDIQILYPEDIPVQKMSLDLGVSGPFSELMNVLNSERLGYADDFGIDPDTVTGVFSARLRFALPRLDDLEAVEVAIAAAANVEDAFLGEVVDGMSVEIVAAEVELDGNGMLARGRARLNGTLADFAWNRPFAEGTPRGTEWIDLSSTVGDADRARLGIPQLLGLTGNMPIEVHVVPGAAGAAQLHISADLADTRFAVGAAGLEKPVGVGGRLEATVIFHNGDVSQIENLSLVTDHGLELAGGIRLGPGDFGISSLQLTRARWRETSGTVELEYDPVRELITGSIIADRLDVDAFLAGDGQKGGDADSDGGDFAGAQDFDLFMQAREIVLGHGLSMTGVTGRALRQDGEWQFVDVQGSLGESPVAARYDRAGGQGLSIRANDFGGLLRGLGLTEVIEGGRAEVLAHPEGPGGAYVGQVAAADFVVREFPILARLLAAVSVVGIADALADGLAFSRLDGEFIYDGSDEILTITRLRTAGGTIGIRLAGRVDLAGEHLDLEGTIVPARIINQLLSGIPLIGDILTGPSGDGILAFTYTVRGPVDDPAVTVNPLSILAPGIIREILFQSADVAAPPDDGSTEE